MFKKLWFSLLILTLLLVACDDNQKGAKSHKENNSNQGAVTNEDWEQLGLKSKWYENLILPSDDFYIEMIDFEGDKIPEMFIGYNGENYGYIIAKYNSKKDIWEEWANQPHKAKTYGAITFEGSLKGKDDRAIALITNYLEDTTLDDIETLNLLQVSEDGQKIVNGKSYRLYDSDLIVDAATNTFTVQSEIDIEQFTINDNIVSSDYRTTNLYTGSPIIQNKKFEKLLDHDFFNTNIDFGDTFANAKNKAGKSISEDYYEGGYCAFYDDYFFCLVEEDIPLEYYYLSDFKDISKADIEKVIDKKIEILNYEKFETSGEVVYYSIFEVDNTYFYAEFDNDKTNAKLKKLTISLDKFDN